MVHRIAYRLGDVYTLDGDNLEKKQAFARDLKYLKTSR